MRGWFWVCGRVEEYDEGDAFETLTSALRDAVTESRFHCETRYVVHAKAADAVLLYQVNYNENNGEHHIIEKGLR